MKRLRSTMSCFYISDKAGEGRAHGNALRGLRHEEEEHHYSPAVCVPINISMAHSL